MLYLAEVKKQTRRFMGGWTTELKLLAGQRNDQTWSAVLAEEIVVCDELEPLGEGALLMVNVENRQIQGKPKLAGGDIVRLLQNFSRLMGNSKDQEEEIEQWKQSLTYQSQELTRREMEMEARLEELEKREQEFVDLQQQRQELEKAWESLKEEQQQLGEFKNEVSLLTASANSDNAARGELAERINLLEEVVNREQANLNRYWQQLEQEKREAQQKQAEVERQGETLSSRKQQWQSLQESLEQAQKELSVQQQVLQSKQELVQRLNWQNQSYEDLKQDIVRMVSESGDIQLQQQVDIQAIENMPLQELQEVVGNLRTDLEKLVRFVSDEEEELVLQCQTIKELEEKIQTANEYDRFRLENELAEEQERKIMLDETLVGQRRIIREKDDVLRQHWRILQRRQGKVDLNEDPQKTDLGPILLQLEDRQYSLGQEISQLTTEIEQMRSSLQQLQTMIEQQSIQRQAKFLEWQQQEEEWQKARLEIEQFQSRLNVYEQIIQPFQDNLTQIQQNLESMAQFIAQMTEDNDNSHPTFA